jgi:hypothetical protein
MTRLAVATAVVLALSAGPAAAARVHLVAQPAVVVPGAIVQVSTTASQCLADDQVTLISAAFPGHAFGLGAVLGRAGRHGAFTIRARTRAALKAGRYHVSVRCGGGTLGVLAYFRVA